MAYPDKTAYAQCIVAYCEGPGQEIKVREMKERDKEIERDEGRKRAGEWRGWSDKEKGREDETYREIER